MNNLYLLHSFAIIASLTVFTMSSQVNSYFFNNSFGAPDSPNVSLIPTFFTIVGQDSPTTSLTAEPNPQLCYVLLQLQ